MWRTGRSGWTWFISGGPWLGDRSQGEEEKIVGPLITRMGAPVKPPGRGPGFTGQANKNEERIISALLTPVKPCKTGNPEINTQRVPV